MNGFPSSTYFSVAPEEVRKALIALEASKDRAKTQQCRKKS